MKLWHLSDPHLSFAGLYGYDCIKDMIKFGPCWADWQRVLLEDWKSKVSSDDIVLLGGDMLWPSQAMYHTLSRLKELPGIKNFIPGNHDKFITRGIGSLGLEKFKQEMLTKYDLNFIGDSYIAYGEIVIVGKMLFDLPTQTFYSRYAGNEGKYDNELHHLRNMMDLYEDVLKTYKYRIFLSHYCPVDNNWDFQGSTFLKEIQRMNPTHCLFGHYHGMEVWNFMKSTKFEWNKIQFINSSPDLNNMQMNLILEI